VISAAFGRKTKGWRTAQFAMNLDDLKLAAETEQAARQGWFLVANHPFGGGAGVAEFRPRIEALHRNTALEAGLREKLTPDAALMPELVLNLILNGTGVHAAIPAMMQPRHLEANIRAVEHCRFSGQELARLRGLLLEQQESRPS
jgi:aryl-alcohol dehydrogenase-like predicted oxidoreductase